MTTKILLPNLHFKDFQHLILGPVEFHAVSPSSVEIRTNIDLPEDQVHQLLLHSLYLLFFSCNAHKIYNGETPDPLRSFFQRQESQQKTEILKEAIDPQIFPAFSQLLFFAYTVGEKRGIESKKIIQSICLLLDRYLAEPEDWKYPDWHHYINLSIGFETLFDLNPADPSADLRQKLRPLLHLKYSRPVEILWKWINHFFMARFLFQKGQSPKISQFIENPNVRSPLYLIAEKILIFSIYDLLFQWHLSLGIAGTISTPDRFARIPPERILVYFWTVETLEKKITLLTLQEEESTNKDLEMIQSIKNMHEQLQRLAPSPHQGLEIFIS